MVLRFKSAKASFKRLIADERGVSAIEYGLLASLVALASVQAMGGLGDVLDTSFGAAASDFSDGGADDVAPGMGAGGPEGSSGGDDSATEPPIAAADAPDEPSIAAAEEPSVAAAGMAYEESSAGIQIEEDVTSNSGGNGGGNNTGGGGAEEPPYAAMSDPDSGL